jgi:diguanylate cyclase (GGDEF)-like protein
LALYVHAASALLWILVATGWLLAQSWAPSSSSLSVGLFAGYLAALGVLGLALRAPLRKSQASGFFLVLAAIAAQILLPREPLSTSLGLSAALLVLLPVTGPTDRFHALAAGLAQILSLVMANQGVWGGAAIRVQPLEAGLIGLGWTILALLALESQIRSQSPKARMDLEPSGHGGLVVGGSSPSADSQRSKPGFAAASAASTSTTSSSSLRLPRVRPDEEPSGQPEDGLDPTSSQILSRSKLLEQEEVARAQMSELLEPVVLFMNKNFRPYCALGFLVDPATGNLRIDTAFGKGKVKQDAVIVPGQGLLGGIVGRSGGFITGDISVYGQAPEYYPEGERVLSMMAMPVRNEDTNELQALLVVDSQSPRAFNDSHFEWLRRFGSIASALVTVQHAKSAVARQAKITEAFYEIQSRLTKHLKIEELLGVLDDALLDLFQYDRMIFASWNQVKQKAQVVHVAGSSHQLERGALFDLADTRSFYGNVFRTRQERLIAGLGEFHLFDDALDRQLGTLPVEVLGVPLLNDDRKCIGVLGVESLESGRYTQMDLKLLAAIASIASNALSRAHMYQQMERLATIDGLTQIPNHRHFQTLVSQQMETAARYGQQASLMLFDIDHFKSFNDTYGHPVGDQVLKEVAKCVQGAVRASDILARYGGEEFVVFLPMTDSDNAMLSAERVRAAVEAMEIPHESGKMLKVTISIGVCTFPDLADAKQALIDSADKAMYFSKKTGRNRVSLYGPESEALAVAKEAGPPQPGH